jgi:hypothetical protein
MILGQPLQQAYVTTDIDEACRVWERRFGVSQFLRPARQTMTLDDGRVLTLHNAHARIGSTWLELIQPIDGEIGLYRDGWLPASGFGMTFHHMGVVLDQTIDLDATLAEAKDNGIGTVLSINVQGYRACYIDTVPTLGHYVEYLYFPGQGLAQMLDRIPQNLA